MLLTQEPTFVMVVTQELATNISKKEKNKKKNCGHSCISNPGIIYCYIPSPCKSELQIQKF